MKLNHQKLNFVCVTGHKSFLSFVYLDYCYNNPVMHVFIHILQATRKETKSDDDVELVGADNLERRNISRGNGCHML